VPRDFQYLGAGYLPEIGPDTGYNNLTVLLGLIAVAFVGYRAISTRRRNVRLGSPQAPLSAELARNGLLIAALLYATWLFATGRPGTSFPIPGLILLAMVLLFGFLSSRTVVGRHVYAVGGNRHAAELSGVRSKRVNFLVMMNMSVLAALAGMIFVGRATSSGPFDGVGWELDAIAAVFIGGAAVTGGVGTVTGAVIGGLVMAVLNNGLQLMGIGADLTQVIKGLVLLAAVAFDVFNKMQGRPSMIGLIMKGLRGTPAEPEKKPDRESNLTTV